MKKKKVQIVLINPENQSVLLLQTNARRNSFWQNVTGSVEPNESLRLAAIREVDEETGIQLSPENLIKLDLRFHFSSAQEGYPIKETPFIGLCSFSSIKISPEHQAYKILPIQEIGRGNYLFLSNYLAFLSAIEKLKK